MTDLVERLRQAAKFGGHYAAAADEIARLQEELAGTKDDYLRVHKDKMDLWGKNFELRAALEQILAIDQMTQDVLTDDRFDVACGIARKAIAKEEKE